MSKKTHENFLIDLYKVNENLIVLNKYYNSQTLIECKCTIHDYVFQKKAYTLLHGCGCPVCSKNIILKGVNDVNTTHSHISKYLVNISDGDRLHINSKEKVNVKCVYCGHKKLSSLSDLNKYGVSCPICGDKISYPNKFIRNIFEQLGVEYTSEKIFEWNDKNKKRLYDIYLPDTNTIIEVNGDFHYKECHFYNQYYEKVKENDKYKKRIAIQNGISKYIKIDCSKSSIEYIKNSVLSSEIASMFDLSIIDWLMCHEKSLNNTTKDICDAWNTGIKNTSDLANIFKLNKNTIVRHLKKGAQIGWCLYNSKEELKKNGAKNSKKYRAKKIRCVEYDMVFNSLSDCSRYFKETYGLNVTATGISSIKNGKNKTHCGLHFEYV